VTDQTAAQPPIVFGTDGWRARIAEDYTYENVRRCAEGVARYAIDRGTASRGVVVGYDRRFASEYFAQAAAEVLLAFDIPVFFAAAPIPTQMTSFEVVQRSAATAIMITASHNPWIDNGFKVKAPSGAAAGPEILHVLERTIAERAGQVPPRRPFADAEAAGLVERFDPFDGRSTWTGCGRPTCGCWWSRSTGRARAGSRGSWRAAGSRCGRSTPSATPISEV
jgi:phosphomannomutase